MSDHIFTDNNFDSEVLRSDKPVLVDFWGPGCAPCLVQAPIIEELASEMSGSVKIGKLNIAENSMTANRFGVMSLPTLLVFNNGQVVSQMMGLQQKNILRERLESL